MVGRMANTVVRIGGLEFKVEVVEGVVDERGEAVLAWTDVRRGRIQVEAGLPEGNRVAALASAVRQLWRLMGAPGSGGLSAEDDALLFGLQVSGLVRDLAEPGRLGGAELGRGDVVAGRMAVVERVESGDPGEPAESGPVAEGEVEERRFVTVEEEERGRRVAPLGSVYAMEAVEPPAGLPGRAYVEEEAEVRRYAQCMGCGGLVADGSIVSSRPWLHPDPREGWAVERVLHCAGCGHLQVWHQAATRDGRLKARVLRRPEVVKGVSAVEAWLKRHPWAAEVVEG